MNFTFFNFKEENGALIESLKKELSFFNGQKEELETKLAATRSDFEECSAKLKISESRLFTLFLSIFKQYFSIYLIFFKDDLESVTRKLDEQTERANEYSSKYEAVLANFDKNLKKNQG